MDYRPSGGGGRWRLGLVVAYVFFFLLSHLLFLRGHLLLVGHVGTFSLWRRWLRRWWA
jgi:hypothetical protein